MRVQEVREDLLHLDPLMRRKGGLKCTLRMRSALPLLKHRPEIRRERQKLRGQEFA
jgi:hypothetical protein